MKRFAKLDAGKDDTLMSTLSDYRLKGKEMGSRL